MEKKLFKRITGVGNALVDILINESDQFLIDIGKEKGGMTYTKDTMIMDLLSKAGQKPDIIPGGATCNTMIGVGMLGSPARFIGRIGKDNFGDLFKIYLEACHVEPLISTSPTPTGKCLSVITPDAQRSMFTFLGAAVELAPEAIIPDMFNDTAIAMIEGYLVFNPDLIMASLKAAKQANAMIAMDLASFEVVNAARDILDRIVKEYVDILIANEDEARAFTGFSDETRALEALSENVTCGVLKVGSKGSYVSYNKTITKIDPVTGKDPIDTTGAGDLWAAGFLFGIANGFSVEKSGYLASACGYEVCQVIGTKIPDSGWKRIHHLI